MLREAFDLAVIAYTRGADGSILVTADEADDHLGRPVDVVDSVGAGDSFTAALCMGLLNGRPLAAINDHANRIGAFVCGQTGATPVFPGEFL
ncbi:MAG: hypothetical protein HN341_10980 [Verrucomicrobia bacterium]|jgi:fructokinase|nr:hypothetical protein [Verrucomicrobiota bacterium]